jgi:hypothetical protein
MTVILIDIDGMAISLAYSNVDRTYSTTGKASIELWAAASRNLNLRMIVIDVESSRDRLELEIHQINRRSVHHDIDNHLSELSS